MPPFRTKWTDDNDDLMIALPSIYLQTGCPSRSICPSVCLSVSLSCICQTVSEHSSGFHSKEFSNGFSRVILHGSGFYPPSKEVVTGITYISCMSTVTCNKKTRNEFSKNCSIWIISWGKSLFLQNFNSCN